MSIVQERQQAEPYVIVVGTMGDPRQAFLVVDCHVIREVVLNKIPFVLVVIVSGVTICFLIWRCCVWMLNITNC